MGGVVYMYVIGATKSALRAFFGYMLYVRYWSQIPKNAMKMYVVFLGGLLVPFSMLPM